jgi:hypothetical protein
VGGYFNAWQEFSRPAEKSVSIAQEPFAQDLTTMNLLLLK